MIKVCHEIANLLCVIFNYSILDCYYLAFHREKRENPGGVVKEGRRLRALTKNEEAEFATGLIIG